MCPCLSGLLLPGFVCRRGSQTGKRMRGRHAVVRSAQEERERGGKWAGRKWRRAQSPSGCSILSPLGSRLTSVPGPMVMVRCGSHSAIASVFILRASYSSSQIPASLPSCKPGSSSQGLKLESPKGWPTFLFSFCPRSQRRRGKRGTSINQFTTLTAGRREPQPVPGPGEGWQYTSTIWSPVGAAVAEENKGLASLGDQGT